MVGATMLYEIRNGGDDANGAGFNPGNANFPTDLAATSATGNSPVVTSASYNFVAGDVGSYVYIKSGTNWTPGFYPIASVAANAATLNAAVGAVVLVDTVSFVPYALNTVAGCATVASPTGGTWGVDYSQQAAAEISFTDLVIDAVTNTDVTSAANPIKVNMIGNRINITSGTGFTVAGYELVSIPSGVIGRFDRAVGTVGSTGGNGKLGGGWATPGKAGHIAGGAGAEGFLNQIVFIKYNASAYSMSATENVAGGKINDAYNANGHAGRYIGYDTGRFLYNTDSSRPTFQATAGSFIMLRVAGANGMIRNIIVDANGNTVITGIHAQAGVHVFNCKSLACESGFTVGGIFATVEKCEAANPPSGKTGFSLGATGVASMFDCTVTGMTAGATTIGVDCTDASVGVIQGLTVSGTTGIGIALRGQVNVNGYSASGLTTGISGCDSANVMVRNAVIWNCTTNYTATAVASSSRFINCAGGGSGTNLNNIAEHQKIGFVTLTVDPFTNSGGGNYGLNNTAGGGAACRAVGSPGTLPGLSTTSYMDMGAVQHECAGGGAGPLVGPGRLVRS